MSNSQQALLARAREHLNARRPGLACNDFAEALALGAGDADDYNDYGRALNNLRNFDAARQAFASAIALKPEFAEAHNNLGHVLRALNKADEAAQCFRRALALKPDYAAAWRNLGTVLALLGDYPAAIDALEKAVELVPGDADAHLSLAGLYRVTDSASEAEQHIRRAVALAPDLVDAKIQLASLHESQGEIEQAIQLYRGALAQDELNAEALAGLADVMDKSGQYDEALDLLQPGIAAHPDNPKLAVAQARLMRRIGKAEEALALLSAVHDARPEETERLPRYFFTLGEIYDELGQFDAAFASYKRGNELKTERFDPAQITSAVDALIEVFTDEFFSRSAAWGEDSERPVFIIGMPRSGTSLVEQVLASHPLVHGGGELRLLSDMARDLGADPALAAPYPNCLEALTAARVRELAGSHLEKLEAIDAEAPRLTDKMPHNFLHLGLIHLLFPRARVIHCVRNPLDTILSCYFQDFASSGMAFSNDLDHLTVYYQQYHRLMRHWQQVLPARCLEVAYENLVSDFEAMARKLVSYVGLEWNEAVLQFHSNRRLVKTASHAQVRQPIYTRSLARHARYARHLEKVRAMLGELVPAADL